MSHLRPTFALALVLLWLAQGVFHSAWHHHHGPAGSAHRATCGHHSHVDSEHDHRHEAVGGSSAACGHDHQHDHPGEHSPTHPSPDSHDDCAVCQFLAKQPLPLCVTPLLEATGVVQSVTQRPALIPASTPLLVHHARAPPARV